jgi:hypothetical protein
MSGRLGLGFCENTSAALQSTGHLFVGLTAILARLSVLLHILDDRRAAPSILTVVAAIRECIHATKPDMRMSGFEDLPGVVRRLA